MARGVSIDQLPTLNLGDATTNDLLVVYDNETGSTRKLILGDVAERLAVIGGYSLEGEDGNSSFFGGGNGTSVEDNWPTTATADGNNIFLNCGAMSSIEYIQATVAVKDVVLDDVNVYAFKYKVDNGTPKLIGLEWDASHTSVGDSPSIFSAEDSDGDLVISLETVNTNRTLSLSYVSVAVT